MVEFSIDIDFQRAVISTSFGLVVWKHRLAPGKDWDRGRRQKDQPTPAENHHLINGQLELGVIIPGIEFHQRMKYGYNRIFRHMIRINVNDINYTAIGIFS